MVLFLIGCRTSTAPEPVLGFTPQPPQPGEEPPAADAAVAATVNGQPITVDAFNRELARFEAGQVALGFQVSDEAGYRQQVLDLLIEQELIRQEAARQGITISEEEVDRVLNEMVQETGQEYFDSWLQTNYYTRDEFREIVRLDLMTGELLAPVIEAVPTRAQHVHARHILVNTQTEAEAVLNRLQAGEDFGTLAAQFSVDVTTRDRGGDLGWFPRGGLLVPEVETIAFEQAPGQTSGVFSSAWGFHIVQTLEFDPDREIDAETRQRLLESYIDAWRIELRLEADVQQMISLTS